MEARVAKIEAHIEHVLADLSALKADMRDIRERLAKIETRLYRLPTKASWPRLARKRAWSLEAGSKDLRCCQIRGADKGHEAYEDDGAHPRLTRCDLFDNGELLWRMGRPPDRAL